MKTFLILVRLAFRQRFRSLLAVGQRSLLFLLALPLLVVGSYYLLDRFDDQLFSYLTQAPANERLGLLRTALVSSWLALLAGSVLFQVARPEGADDRTWALTNLPVSERKARAAASAPWSVLLVVVCSVLGSLFGRQVGPAFALYGAPVIWSCVVLSVFFIGAVAAASSFVRLAHHLGYRVARRLPHLSGAAEWSALAVLALAFWLLLPRVRGSWAGAIDDYFNAWLVAVGPSSAGFELASAAGLTIAPALIVILAIALLASPRIERTAVARDGSKNSSHSQLRAISPPNVVAGHDLRSFRREKSGLVTALFAQVFFALLVTISFSIPAVRESGKVQAQLLRNMSIGMPIVWALLATLSFGFDMYSGKQLLTAPLSLFDRTWGKFIAALKFCGFNWLVCLVVMGLNFGFPAMLATAGPSLATLILGVGAAVLAGRILPVELRGSGAVGGGSFHTWVLAGAFVALSGGLALGASVWVQQETGSIVLGQFAQVVVAFLGAAFFFRGIMKVQLRHGLDPR